MKYKSILVCLCQTSSALLDFDELAILVLLLVDRLEKSQLAALLLDHLGELVSVRKVHDGEPDDSNGQSQSSHDYARRWPQRQDADSIGNDHATYRRSRWKLR